MANVKAAERLRVVDVLQRYGRCVELVRMDPNFHEISVGLYVKDGTATVWTYSQKPGVGERLTKIRDQLVALGGMEPVEGTDNQAKYPCGQMHGRPTKFLMMQAVEKDPEYSQPEGKFPSKDFRSSLRLGLDASEVDGRWAYRVIAQGDDPKADARLRAVTAGFVRYGEMDKVGEDLVGFPCGHRHEQLARLVLPYARNVSQVEDMLAAQALRGQITTQTVGFSPPS